MGYTSTKAQLLSVGPYVRQPPSHSLSLPLLLTTHQVAACLTSILVGWLSDRYKKRAVLIMCSVPIGIVGFFMLEFLPASMPSAKYGALYLGASGIYAFLPLWLAWVHLSNSHQPLVTVQ